MNNIRYWLTKLANFFYKNRRILIFMGYLLLCILSFLFGAKQLIYVTPEEEKIIQQLFGLEGGSHFIVFIVMTTVSMGIALKAMMELFELLDYVYRRRKRRQRSMMV